MILTEVPGLVVLMLVAIAAFELFRRSRVWRIGKAAPVAWRTGLRAMPRRYLVDVHHIVARDRFTARMHALAAGGVLGGSALLLLGLAADLHQSRLLGLFTTLAFGAEIAGAVMVRKRRGVTPPTRLSKGRFNRLPFFIAVYGLGGLATGLSMALHQLSLLYLGVIFLALGGFGLAFNIRVGPMRHALAGALHLAAHPRPERFSGKPSTTLRPLDLDASRLGIETPSDLEWNRLLGFDACVQCGRCEAACPAFASGQPLNPKKLIQDLVKAASPDSLPYTGSPTPNERPVTGRCGPNEPIIGGVIHADTLWSCTTCRACVEECPMMIEHVDAIIGLRRHQTLELGAIPAKAVQPLADLRYAEEVGARPLARRTDFAAGLPLRVLEHGGKTDILLWLGEGAYDLRYGRTLRALVQLLHVAQVDFAVLGPQERDCGDLARRLGDEATFRDLALANIATLQARSFNRILTADPHALQVIRNEYRSFGGRFDVIHHTAFLAELVEAGRLSLQSQSGALTYHDPCYLARYQFETEAPRKLLAAMGLRLTEMERHGRRAMCCGGGGGAPVSDISGDVRIPDLRMDQARATGTALVAVACPQCTAMLEGVAGDRPEVKDIAELLLAAVEGTS